MIPAAKACLTVPAIAVLAAALAACTTSQYAPREGYNPGPTREVPRPNFPIAPPGPLSTAPADAPVATTPPPPPPPPPPPAAESDAPTARPSGTVTSQSLPPPQAQPYSPPPASSNVPPLQSTPATPPPASPSSYVAPPPAPVTTTTTVTSVSGRVVDVSGGPQSYTIKNGDTLTSISKRMGLTQKELADLNDLEPPYALRAGKTLKGPATKAKAYVVGQGDTMFAIARRFTVTAAALAEENDLRTSSSIRAGQRLTLPKGYKDTGPVRRTVTNTVPGVASTQVAQTQPQPYTPPPSATPSTTVTTTASATPTRPATTTTTTTTTAPPRPGAAPVTTTTTTVRPVGPPPAVATNLPVNSPAMTDAEIAAAGRGRFAWPVRGPVISGFGPTGAGGQRNDGLDLRAPEGDPVRSAAAGEVVYAGNSVPGFGNLVLVKHDDGWVTAYAHLARADVRMQQKVAQGQQIGQVGSSGGAPEPQLHFEVRYARSPKDNARPIDPALVLPK
ncbi:MAG: peptidoglycan DD-metalloendopeptidase family protein [Caulobacterales bacterium]|nr:peptidoglycan DD-metalloendopeptidase family protein [Caulobacterales bacterium]